MPKSTAAQILTDLLETCEKCKSIDNIADVPITRYLEQKAKYDVSKLIVDNLFYYMNANTFKYGKQAVLDLAKEVPQLAAYLKDHNRSYSSQPRFTQEELSQLKQ